MRVLDGVVALNLALVMAHQADAAYWKEWEMFGIPGGIQAFTLFNLGAFALLLWCFVAVVKRKRWAGRGCQSGLMPALLMTLAHWLISARMNSLKTVLLVPRGMAPVSRMRRWISLEASTVRTSLVTRSAMTAGSPAGAHRPFHSCTA